LPPRPPFGLLQTNSSGRDKRAQTVHTNKKNETGRNSLSPLVFGNSNDEQDELNNLCSVQEDEKEMVM